MTYGQSSNLGYPSSTSLNNSNRHFDRKKVYLLILLIGQVVLSNAKTPKPVIIPAPDGVNTSWGHSVDISGKTLIAGYTSYTGDKGGVFILEQQGKRWEVLNHFRTQNENMRDWFGHAVAVSGNIAVISAYEFGGNKVTAGWVLGGGPGRV